MIAQQKDPASNVAEAKRPLKKDDEGKMVPMNDAELEQIRAKVIEQRYATGDVKTMPTWDEVTKGYIEFQKKNKNKKPETKEEKDGYRSPTRSRQMLSDLFSGMNEQYGTFKEKQAENFPSKEDFSAEPITYTRLPGDTLKHPLITPR